MRSMKISCGLAAALLLTCAASSAHAAPLALRTWVSGVGDDEKPCSRTAPCKTFAGAIAKTEAGGEISVLDPGAYGSVTITKSVTINGTPGSGYGSVIGYDGTNVIVINMSKDDPYQTVRLNWLDLNGQGKALHGIRIVDGQPAGVSVVIENTNIGGFTGSGILDERSAGGKLVVANTMVRHTWQSGILINGGGKGNKVKATLSNVGVHNSFHAGLLAIGGGWVTVSNSVFSGNSWGAAADGGSAVFVDGSASTGNNQLGVYTDNGGVVWLSNSDVSFNGTDVFGGVQSFSTSRFTGNGAAGPVTPIGAPTSATGLR